MRLSVIVTIVDGGDALVRCLDGLSAQQDPPALEVIVPYDESAGDMTRFATRFPAVNFLPLGRIETASPPMTPAGQHELFDRRRAAGLARATGDLIAILEDRGIPRRNWAAEAVRLHRESPAAVIGGAVENRCDRTLNWAVYFCDFGRYQLPFPAAIRDWVTDVNVCYMRRAIEATRHLWAERYHEPVVHDEIVRLGDPLRISPTLVVEQDRGELSLAALIGERVAWGRLFGGLRVRHATWPSRLALAAATPILPALLFVRHARMQSAKRVTLGKFVAAAPAVLVLLAAWSAGEMAGYLTGKGARP
jgi:hypothetical protein